MMPFGDWFNDVPLYLHPKRYHVIEFLRNAAIDQRSFIENVEELVLQGKDPLFPEFALYTLSQLDKG